MIDLKNIVFDTPKGRRILNDFSLGLEFGSWTMLTGPSGVGKTTVLFLLGLLQKPQQGAYYFQGEELFKDGRFQFGEARLAEQRLRRIGFMFQDSRLLEHLDVLHNVATPAWLLKRDRKAAMEAARVHCDALGLADLLDQNVRSLSAGERQRTALARALVNEPSLLLADEPTGNLDGDSSLALLEYLQNIRKAGLTILMVTHDREWMHFADREVKIPKLSTY